MSRDTSEMIIAVMPDGPVAFDGKNYRYSKGERLYLDNLALHFRELHLLTFVLQKNDPFYESCVHSCFEAENIKVIELPRVKGKKQAGVLRKAWQFLKVFLLLMRVVPRIDLLYVFLPSYPSALGWVAAQLWRKDHIVYGADDWEQASESMFRWESLRGTRFYRLYARLNRLMERTIVKTALFTVAAGGQLREKYKKFGSPSYDTTPRMTLTSADIFERADTCTGEKIVLINVGSLIHDKAQHILIEAFASLSRQNDQIYLRLVGDGPEQSRLEALVEKFNIKDRVEFVGYVEEEEELYSMLRSADIFVLSSVTEGFPRVLYEAMTMRLPIVTTDVGGIPYLLTDNVNARVVSSGDVTGLESAIHDVIKNGDLRRKMILEASRTMQSVFSRTNTAQISTLIKSHYDRIGCS